MFSAYCCEVEGGTKFRAFLHSRMREGRKQGRLAHFAGKARCEKVLRETVTGEARLPPPFLPIQSRICFGYLFNPQNFYQSYQAPVEFWIERCGGDGGGRQSYTFPVKAHPRPLRIAACWPFSALYGPADAMPIAHCALRALAQANTSFSS